MLRRDIELSAPRTLDRTCTEAEWEGMIRGGQLFVDACGKIGQASKSRTTWGEKMCLIQQRTA